MIRSFVVEFVYDIDARVYEVYPVSSCFSYIVYSGFEIYPCDIVTVKFTANGSQVVKIVRNGEVVYDVQS